MKYERVYLSSREMILEQSSQSKITLLFETIISSLIWPMMLFMMVGVFATINASSLSRNVVLGVCALLVLFWVGISVKNELRRGQTYSFDGHAGQVKFGEELLFSGKAIEKILIQEKMKGWGRSRKKVKYIQLVLGDEYHNLPIETGSEKTIYELVDEIAEVLTSPVFYQPLK